jgi:hypothetical protein
MKGKRDERKKFNHWDEKIKHRHKKHCRPCDDGTGDEPEDDVVANPTEQGYPPAGGLFSFVGVVIYTFPETRKVHEHGFENLPLPRFDLDIVTARTLWNLPIINTRIIDISDNNFGWNKNDLTCGKDFANSDFFQKLQQRRVADGVPNDWITVWYAPVNFNDFNEVTGGTVGCTYPNENFPRDTGPELQNIIIGNAANQFALAHELGHVFYFTIPGNAKGADPTGNGTVHSTLPNNLMNPKNGSSLVEIQRQRASDSRLFPRGIKLP